MPALAQGQPHPIIPSGLCSLAIPGIARCMLHLAPLLRHSFHCLPLNLNSATERVDNHLPAGADVLLGKTEQALEVVGLVLELVEARPIVLDRVQVRVHLLVLDQRQIDNHRRSLRLCLPVARFLAGHVVALGPKHRTRTCTHPLEEAWREVRERQAVGLCVRGGTGQLAALVDGLVRRERPRVHHHHHVHRTLAAQQRRHRHVEVDAGVGQHQLLVRLDRLARP
mmetsp:Transcript_14254/g.28376  ORF Transcript_14254/g.28376 Transcript_14254/m.28376 type:complete len:225 (-) Transcript_14254:1205-1879(-)